MPYETSWVLPEGDDIESVFDRRAYVHKLISLSRKRKFQFRVMNEKLFRDGYYDFTGVDLSNATITNCQLHHSCFVNAKLDGSKITNTNFDNSDMTNVSRSWYLKTT